ncbi:hypothetical protein [Uliginosibacterium sediminicola]|uniref:Adenylyltransferase SoFic-like C-terminal domain-containing protein n=1 Tax=Uliginosibacterium sediminicola TaxID=2024550 RepID=A0ABU9Z1H3_9RHOO
MAASIVFEPSKSRHAPMAQPPVALEALAIRSLMQDTAETMRRNARQIYSRELVELIFEQLSCRIGDLVDAGPAQQRTASTHIKKLCNIGTLREEKAGLEKLFIRPCHSASSIRARPYEPRQSPTTRLHRLERNTSKLAPQERA